MKNFFRKDLKLQDRWWHRMIVSIYFLFLAAFIVGSMVNFYNIYNRPSLESIYGIKPQTQRHPLDSIYGVTDSQTPQDQWKQSLTDVGMPNIPTKEPSPTYQKFKTPVEGLVLGISIFLLMIIFYYKIILYIIFGSKG